jgi:hypothetical protein
MSTIIKKFYEENKIPLVLLKQKMRSFEKYPDIAEEFEYWIQHRAYKSDGITVEGYTAKQISEESQYMNGEGTFMMLIELRENPQKALAKIARGFKIR